MMLSFPTVLFAMGLLLSSAALIWAALSDARRFTIPNRASLLTVGGYLLALPHLGPQAWLMGLVMGVLILAAGAVVFALKLVGGGDVKLGAAIGVWIGPAFIGEFLFLTSLASLILGAAMLTTPLPRLFGRQRCISSGHNFVQPMPFALPLSAGGLWVMGLHLGSLG